MHLIISGGTRGIGAATVRKFIGNGFSATVLYSSDDKAKDALLCELNDHSDNLLFIKADVSDPNAVKEAVSKAVSVFGVIDVLVSNAGISYVGLSDTFDHSDYRKIMDINFGGFFNLVHEIIPSMISRKTGNIIAVSSMWGQEGASCEALYSATKGAVDAYVRSLSKELGPSGIRVNAVSPGVIKTDMLNCFSDEDMEGLAEETSLGRIGKPFEVADLIYYLASDQSSFITGQIVGINGGFV
ncbi:MAG: SDR family oxidoreductase [Clostridiales bacterium]|nr:SDR family oxidoreductase [Clostridiales bacterium]